MSWCTPKKKNQEHLSTCVKSQCVSNDAQRQGTISNNLCQMQEVFENEDVRVLQEVLIKAGNNLQQELMYVLGIQNQKRSKIRYTNSDVPDKIQQKKDQHSSDSDSKCSRISTTSGNDSES
eukprot:5596193-Ditylum_brightwellii.AAC.1